MQNQQRQSSFLERALELASMARRHVRLVFLCVITGSIIAAVVSFLVPSVWVSDASFEPEQPELGALSGGLAGLASELAAGGAGVNPQFFADLVTSRTVTRRLAAASFPSKDGVRPLTAIYGYGKLPPETALQRATGQLSKDISASMNFRTGVVAFSAKGETPEMAKAIADSVLAVVNDFNVHLRQGRAKAERLFAEQRVVEARRTLSEAEDAVLSWELANREANTPTLRRDFLRLKRQEEIASAMYTQVRSNLEQSKLEEVRNTPAVTVLEAPLQPTIRAWPKRKLMVVAGALAGLAVAIAYLMLAMPAVGRPEELPIPESPRPWSHAANQRVAP